MTRHDYPGSQRGRFDPRRQRLAMVRDQLEARDITSKAVLDAMRTVPRHQFIPAAFAAHAYEDAAIPIGYGQTISQPYMVARMSQFLNVRPGMRVLEIGSGCGYQAAVLAAMGCAVFGIERIRELYHGAVARIRSLGLRSINLYFGDGTLGLPAAAPFDRIIVSAGGPEIPPPLIRQLGGNGLLLMPVGDSLRSQRLIRLKKNGTNIFAEDLGGAMFVDLVSSTGREMPMTGREKSLYDRFATYAR